MLSIYVLFRNWLIPLVISKLVLNSLLKNCQSSVLECSSCVELRVKVNVDLSIRKGRLYAHRGVSQCASGLIHSQCGDWLWPQEWPYKRAYKLATHWHFCLLTDTSQAAELVSIVYNFLLCIRAVASSNTLYLKLLFEVQWIISISSF